jgi:adenylate cyclase
MTEKRKLAAILAADVVGFSRLPGADEDARAASGIAQSIPPFAVHNGHVFKRTGGGASTAGCEGGESVGQWLLAASI